MTGGEATPDLPNLLPTHMAAVPAVLDVIASGLKKKMNSDEPGMDKFKDAVERKMGIQDLPFLYTGAYMCIHVHTYIHT